MGMIFIKRKRQKKTEDKKTKKTSTISMDIGLDKISEKLITPRNEESDSILFLKNVAERSTNKFLFLQHFEK